MATSKNEAFSQTVHGWEESQTGKTENDTLVSTEKEWKISGMVRDIKTREPLPFVTVAVYKNETLINAAASDMDGNFMLQFKASQIDTRATYSVRMTYVGYAEKTIANIPLSNENFLIDLEFIDLDASLVSVTVGILICEPVKRKGSNPSSNTFKSKDIRRMPH